MKRTPILPLIALSACGGGDWTAETRGESYIEEGIPAADFADGCSVVYDSFLIAMGDVALLDGDGVEVGVVEGQQVFDMVGAGPHVVGSAEVPATHYVNARFSISPASGAVAGNATEAQVTELGRLSMRVKGTLTCGGEEKTFDWSFATDTTYNCEPEDLTIPAGGEVGTQFTIRGDHLFHDGLENPDAEVRGQAIFDADGDHDGLIEEVELDDVEVSTLGYEVGRYSAVTTLYHFVESLTQTLGHVDGEGHCQVDSADLENLVDL